MAIANAHIVVTPHLSQVGLRLDSGGSLPKLFDKLPTLGDDFMLQISYDFVQIVPNNENSLINEPIRWRKIWLTIAYVQISTHCQIWVGKE